MNRRKLVFLILIILTVYFGLLTINFWQINSQLKKIKTHIAKNQIEKLKQDNLDLSEKVQQTSFLLRILPNIGIIKDTKQVLELTNQANDFIKKCFNLGEAGSQLFAAIINNRQENFDDVFSSWKIQTTELEYQIQQLTKNIEKNKNNKILRKFNLKPDEIVSQVNEKVSLIREFNSYLPEFLGVEKDKRYLVLLQNNMELRPTGGFMGSYALLSFKNGVMKNLEIQDIYVPDGQVKGHIEPPVPIQQTFQLGNWRLRDANWDPDFPTSTETILWFFEKGNVKNIDGVFALNLNLAIDLLQTTGPITLIDYNEKVNKDNIYQITQYYAETDFFPGSTQKKDFLSVLAKSIIEKIKTDPQINFLSLMQILLNNLNNNEMLLYFKNEDLQRMTVNQNWDGSLKKSSLLASDSIQDYLAIYETNLGVNKANCCIQRITTHKILTSKEKINHSVLLELTNENKSNESKPPKYWGGRYINFLRIIVPQEVQIEKITIDNLPLSTKDIFIEEQKNNLKSVGFFANVDALTTKKIELIYTLPMADEKIYQLRLQKQPGVRSSPQIIYFNNLSTEIKSDLEKSGLFEFKI